MGMCVITLNFLLLNYILPSIGILMIFLGLRRLRRKPMVSECIWACWDQTASYDISSDRWNIYRQERIEAAEAWKIVSILVGILPLLIFICFFYGLTIELKKRGEKAEKTI